MAGRFATLIRARTLVITHFSQRYRAGNDGMRSGAESVEKLIKQAKDHFNGEVVAADDLLVIPVLFRE